jgi:tRNA1Val (adenine37-N6)-methyltransferase
MLAGREIMKSRGLFHFKQFSLSHERSTHKVGTDGVLLGAWVKTDGAKNILDIGTGSGVIALMLAQKSDAAAIIDAVEIDPEDVKQAVENVSQSPWPEKVIIHHTAIQEFEAEKKYDLIVSNPPYFINSWLPPDEKRSKARHTHELSFSELIGSSKKMLSSSGTLNVILPYQEGLEFRALAQKSGFCLKRELSFRSRAHKPIERLLMAFGFSALPFTSENLVLYDEGENWSSAYKELTKDFYLKA